MIQDFIKDNTLSFEEGSRNTSVTILIGYAQYKGLSKKSLETQLSPQIEEDEFIQDEIDRLWGYCERKTYKNFWSTDTARKQYKF